MTMKTTSHFVGAAIDCRRFADLFVELQNYFESHDLTSDIEFQNVLSLHITIYYLDSTLSTGEMNEILSDTTNINNEGNVNISKLQVRYFGETNKERVCYLGCPKNQQLIEMNDFFTHKYKQSQIAENQLAFVPHISLFRIKNPERYNPHKAKIDTLISRSIETLEYESLISNLHLYQVSSLFHPEIQIPIL
jgi:2'-5' RNA ligase